MEPLFEIGAEDMVDQLAQMLTERDREIAGLRAAIRKLIERESRSEPSSAEWKSGREDYHE